MKRRQQYPRSARLPPAGAESSDKSNSTSPRSWHCRTRISGTPQKGRVSLAYKSEDELLRILSALGSTAGLPGRSRNGNRIRADGTAGEEENKA